MKYLGSQIVSSRGNNLNAIRLLLALAVILSHSFSLSLGWGGEAKGEPLSSFTHHQVSSGTAAVNLFFFISGLLITASWLRSKTMSDFLMKRVLRIYPGFIVAVGFSGALIWTCCPEFRAEVGYGIAWSIHLLKDWLFLTMDSIDQSGIFSANPFPGAANGSLWSIPIEFHCYLLVAVLGLFCLYQHRLLVLLGAGVLYLVYVAELCGWHSVDATKLRLLTYFLVGMCAWLWRDKIPFSKWLAWSGFIVLLLGSQFKPWFAAVFPIIGGYSVLWIGYGPKLKCLDWTDKMDLSYGVYLYAFPVQQLVAMVASFRSPWIMFVIATPATLLLAWFSWHWVEKRFLAMKNISRKDFDPGLKIRNAGPHSPL